MGEETRDGLSKSLNDLSDKVTELGRTVGHRVTTAVDRTRAQMAQKLGISSTAKNCFNSLMADIRSQSETLKTSATDKSAKGLPIPVNEVHALLRLWNWSRVRL